MENTFKIENGKAVEIIKKEYAVDESLAGLYGEKFQAIQEILRYERLHAIQTALVAELDKRIAICESELGEELTLAVRIASPHREEKEVAESVLNPA